MTVPSLIIIPSLIYSRVLTELVKPWERKSATLPSRPWICLWEAETSRNKVVGLRLSRVDVFLETLQ